MNKKLVSRTEFGNIHIPTTYIRMNGNFGIPRLTLSVCDRMMGRLVQPHSGHVILSPPGRHFSTEKILKFELENHGNTAKLFTCRFVHILSFWQ